MKAWGEAAKLYVENIDVVQEMEKAYREDVDKCVAALEKEIERQLKPLQFRTHQVKDPDGSRTWSITDDLKSPPYLYFANHEPSRIDHNSIVLTAGFRDATPKQIAALVAIGQDSANGCELYSRPSKDGAFDFEVEFEQESFITPAAEKIAGMLRKMHQAFVGQR